MKAFRWLILALLVTASILHASFGEAAGTRTWVSGSGDDVNPCTRSAPCRTFAAALAKTPPGGEIDAIDAGAFGTIVITKSVTIDATGKLASIANSGTNGVTINGGATDIVTLRGLSIGGGGGGLSGIKIIGGGHVNIEDSVVFGNAIGIEAAVTASIRINVRNTVVRNNTGDGIVLGASVGFIAATIASSSFVSNGNGIHVKDGAAVGLLDVNASTNTGIGLAVEGAGMAAAVQASHSMFLSNGTGVATSGVSAVARIADCDVAFNTTGISGSSVLSYGNNRINGNSTDGSVNAVPNGMK